MTQNAASGNVGFGPLSEPWAVRWLDRLTHGAFVLSASLLISITAIYCFEIVGRYFFNSPSIWAQDTITYFLAAMISLAIPEVARTRSHIAISVIQNMLSPSREQQLARLLALLAGLIALLVAYVTGNETFKLYTANIQTLGTVAVPKWWISAFIPTGFLLLALQYLRHALHPAADGAHNPNP
jgi:TRAP-type C4-dicarboxylate transport system permease small subunit